jgi:hypothetical protein
MLDALCRIQDAHSWAPLLASPTPGYTIEGIDGIQSVCSKRLGLGTVRVTVTV